MSEIYFIRHGQASFGSENYDQLCVNGVLQAEALGCHLADLQVRFDAAYSGSMARQQETAREVMTAYRNQGLSFPVPEIDAAWDEIDSTRVWNAQIKMMLKEEPGLLDELNRDRKNLKAFQTVFSRVMARWISGKYDVPGVTSWEEFRQRVNTGLNQIRHSWGISRKIAVFSSGGPIAAAIQTTLDLSGTKTLDLLWQVANTSITRLKYNGEAITLAGFNNVAHLEMQNEVLITYR